MAPVFPFIPRRLVEGESNKYVRARDLENSDFYGRLGEVLRFYHVWFKVDERNEVRVSLKVILDKELSWNYTTKAQDTVWLKDH